ncbi:MAG TPA: ATP-binding protein [Candidatus Binatia bacterium]
MTSERGETLQMLVVEDNLRHAELIRDELEIELPAVSVSIAQGVAEARQALAGQQFDLIILDFRLPDGDGLEVLRELKAQGRSEPVVFVTTSSSASIAVEAMKIGAEDYIVKEEGYVSVLPFVAREVVERARLRAERAELESRLRQAERLASLNTLMAGIAHNLNNPLTTVRTFLELLPQRYESDAEFRTSYYKLVLEEMERIRVLIGSMMQAVAVPKEQADAAPWSVADLLRELEAYASAGLREKYLRLDARCEGELPPLNAARESLKQALIVLVDNAIAFSPEGGLISVVCRPIGQPGGRAGVVFEVSDEGPGVPMEDRAKIFAPFFSTRSGGIGIGLFVAQSVARAHGGSLEVGEREPNGAVFVLSLPLT